MYDANVLDDCIEDHGLIQSLTPQRFFLIFLNPSFTICTEEYFAVIKIIVGMLVCPDSMRCIAKCSGCCQ